MVVSAFDRLVENLDSRFAQMAEGIIKDVAGRLPLTEARTACALILSVMFVVSSVNTWMSLFRQLTWDWTVLSCNMTNGSMGGLTLFCVIIDNKP